MRRKDPDPLRPAPIVVDGNKLDHYGGCLMPMTENQIVKNLQTVKAQVQELLERYPETRNDDFYLSYLWLKYYQKLPLPFLPFRDITGVGGRLESVRRTRQIIQNEEHRFLPTDPRVLESRRNKAEIYRRRLSRR